MRLRIAGRTAVAAVAALLAAGSLTACRTNVGYAATVDGKRYSESDISDYLTPQAKTVEQQSQDGTSTSTPTRSFVVETLIKDRFYAEIIDALPGDPPTGEALDSIRTRGLNGSSIETVTQASGIKGFTSAFDALWIRTRVFESYLSLVQQRLGAGVLQTAVKDLKFDVSVNPRYGTWKASTLSLDSSAGAGAPSFLKLRESFSPVQNATNSGN